jgi:hypothetical protein
MKPKIFCAAIAALVMTATAAMAEQCSVFKTSERRATDPDQIINIIDSKNAIKTRLDDTHASFRNVYFCKTPRDQIAMTCGEVKSGRTGNGYVRFLSNGRPDVTSWEGDGKAGFDSAWARFCKP